MCFKKNLGFKLKEYGDEKIVAIRVGRRPISSMVEKAFNLISLGKWDKLRKKYYYDKLGVVKSMYHDGISGLVVQITILILYHIARLV